MKKKKQVTVEAEYCDICKKEILDRAWTNTQERIKIVRGLFKTADFNAHSVCINDIIREAFKKFFK